MGNVNLHPTGYWFPGEPGYTTTGAATMWQAMAAGDSDYSTPPTNQLIPVEFTFATPTIPAGAKISRVRVNLRSARGNANEQFYVYAITHRRPSGVPSLIAVSPAPGKPNQASDGVLRNWTSAWFTGFSNGNNWNQETPDGSAVTVTLTVEQKAAAPYPGVAKASELSIDVTYNERPAVSAITPSGNQGTSRPTVGWTYSDPEGDAQQKYQVKIFDSTTYGAGSFNPDTSTPAWDSGVVASSVASAIVGADLVNGTTYKAYVKVWQPQVNGEDHYSLWTAGPTFTIVLDPPAPPVVTTVVADTANARLQVNVQGRDNELTANQADIETDTSGWAAGANTTISRITTQFAHGVASLQLASTAGGGTSATTPTGTNGIPVLPNQQYTAMAVARRISATTGRSVRIDIVWYTVAGAVISTSSSATATPTNTGWTTQVSVTANAPANAAFAAVVLNVPGVSAAGEQYAFDQIGLVPGSSTTWTAGGYDNATNALIVERSLDGGVTWTAVRGSPVTGQKATGQLTTIYDYEVPNGLTVQYRARVSNVVAGSTVVGGNSGVVSGIQNAQVWWLKDPIDPTRNMVIKVKAAPRIGRPKPESVNYPVGDTVAAVSHDGVKGAVIECTIFALNSGDYAALVKLLESGRTLLLQDVLGRQWYVQPGDTTFSLHAATKLASETTPIRHSHEVDFQFTEVRVP